MRRRCCASCNKLVRHAFPLSATPAFTGSGKITCSALIVFLQPLECTIFMGGLPQLSTGYSLLQPQPFSYILILVCVCAQDLNTNNVLVYSVTYDTLNVRVAGTTFVFTRMRLIVFQILAWPLKLQRKPQRQLPGRWQGDATCVAPMEIFGACLTFSRVLCALLLLYTIIHPVWQPCVCSPRAAARVWLLRSEGVVSP
jgi:hypothetical protein